LKSPETNIVSTAHWPILDYDNQRDGASRWSGFYIHITLVIGRNIVIFFFILTFYWLLLFYY